MAKIGSESVDIPTSGRLSSSHTVVYLRRIRCIYLHPSELKCLTTERMYQMAHESNETVTDFDVAVLASYYFYTVSGNFEI